MKKILINPFLMFGFTFIFVMMLYQLKLSGLYDAEVGNITYVFIAFSVLSIIIGIIFYYLLLRSDLKRNQKERVFYKKDYAFIVLLLGFTLECVSMSGIPLFLVLRGANYDYTQFGIKTFHVFYMGYLSAASLVHTERFMLSKNKKYLKTPILAIVVTILIMNRGATFLIVFPMLLMCLAMSAKKIRARHYTLVGILIFIFIVLFGVLGDKRMLASGYENEKAIYEIGEADDMFRGLPSGFFWTYLYASSPFANLEYQEKVDNEAQGNIEDYIPAVIYPDFISKYTNPDINDRFELAKITPELNVGTGFSLAFIIGGYAGLIGLFFWFLSVNVLFITLNRSSYSMSTYATLTSIAIFMTFNNMLIFSSCVLQLIFVTVLTRFKVGNKLLI